jgi:glycosyltransferase involved in cell wall biosynthesis
MYEGKTIGVVVPAYNEEKLISRVIETVPDFVDKIIVVDDCSRDQTAQIVKRYQAESSDRVVLVEHATNQGVGGAIATGYEWCRDQEMDVAVVMAGDAQMAPADLPALLDPVVNGEADYAKGNRLFTGEAWNLIPRWRYLGNAGLSLFTKIASGYWHVADSQSGYTAISLKALKTIDWDQMYKRYGQPNDLLVRLNVFNFRVKDVPVKPIYNIGEQSGIKVWKVVPKLSILLIRLFLWRMFQKYVIRDFHPLVFFYTMGFLFFPFSLMYGLFISVRRLVVGPISPISALLAALFFISGVQFLLFAMWFDMDYNKSLR